ncbi:MAG: ribose-phosphate pyrophosphokinase [Acidobacteria bacterium]|nr:MAG: ribose-phosphate pyrophosphokinase [Acidobacteriota bacterium]
MYSELKVFGGRAHRALTEEICAYLEIPTGEVTSFNFSDGEIFCQIEENVRGSDVFIVQPTCPPVNDNLVELLILLDSFKRSSASRVTAVMPYYGYARQDKKDKPRVPITAKLVADLLAAAGADRLLTMDVHAAQISGYFDIPVDHLFAAPVLLEQIKALNEPDLMIVAPDAGGVARARAIAKRLDCDLAIIDKRRVAANVAEVMNVIGDVDGRTALILDDIIDTGGTLVKSVDAILSNGAAKVYAIGIHGILSGPALERLSNSALEAVFVTNTTPLEEKLKACAKLRPLSVAGLLGEAIRRIHDNSSVSSLFV